MRTFTNDDIYGEALIFTKSLNGVKAQEMPSYL
jgi:hypothetical protein